MESKVPESLKSNIVKVGIALGAVALGYFVVQKIWGSNYHSQNLVTMKEQKEDYDVSVYTADTLNGALQKHDGTLHLPLVEKEKITHDTYNFVFKLPEENQELGLPLGGHLFFYAVIPTEEHPEGERIRRKYTPISVIHEKGVVKFPIKVYYKNVHPQFPEGGKMSQYLDQLNLGETVEMEGPKGKLTYFGQGNFEINGKKVKKTQIGMTAGGTGITPIFQIIQAALLNNDSIHMTLLFGNRSENDILLKKELDEFAAKYPDKFTLHYIIDKAIDPQTWTGDVGYVSKQLIQKYMPAPAPDTLMLQ